MSKVFIVLGMHRSATSLVAKALNEIIPMGQELIIAQNETQPKGYYESKAFHALNGDILEAAGGDRKGLVTIPSPAAVRACSLLFEDRIRSVVAQESRTHHIWGWKDPRTVLTIPIIHPHLPVDVHFVCIFRNVNQVVESLSARDRLYGIPERSLNHLAVAMEYNRRLLDYMSEYVGLS